MSPSEPSGTLCLSISGIELRLNGLEAQLLEDLRARFSQFVTERPAGTLDLDLDVMPADVSQFLRTPAQGGPVVYQLETRARDERLHAWSYCFSGRFDLGGPEGVLELCESAFEPAVRSVENFLRVALAWTALRLGRLLVHASGVVRDGRAFIFFGPSGAGKTTIVRMSSGTIVLNDDLILIGRRTGGTFEASGVPFKGADNLGADVAETYPIAGLFRLVQASEASCEALPPARAAGELSGSIPFVTETVEGFERVFPFIADLARVVPFHQLRFRLAPDFWPVVLAATGSSET